MIGGNHWKLSLDHEFITRLEFATTELLQPLSVPQGRVVGAGVALHSNRGQRRYIFQKAVRGSDRRNVTDTTLFRGNHFAPVYLFLILSQRWIAFSKAASIFEPLLEKGRAENISSAISSCVRNLPSDWTHCARATSSSEE